jgi:RNA polymerase sigma-70 factor (ECF subfamily)
MPAPVDPVTPDARYRAVIDAFAPALNRLARGYEADAGRRQDLYQEILVALWRALPAFEERSALKTFVLRVAHNVAASHVARARRERAETWATLEEIEAHPAFGDGHAALEQKERVEQLATLVRALHPLDRQILLSYLDGLEPDEIAEITGLSKTNVTTKVHRVRAVLRAQLEGRKHR